jgi:hypothetical protein
VGLGSQTKTTGAGMQRSIQFVHRRYVIFLLAVALLLALPAGAAMAGTATGGTSTTNTGNTSYSYSSTIATKSGTDSASSRVVVVNGTAGVGHMGVNARAYRSTGALVISSGYTYTTAAGVISLSKPVSFTGSASTYYYSQGAIALYMPSNGSYIRPSTIKSPIQPG